ncbi:unnamed protein product [Cylicostephanus goldi]|uniref:Uncharacterized protein n=1 Tax=Cylicostephanus goldi TaxID=71465 RepID=A0A3P7M0L2_CYLGO|nr:unnamed protein product [Cylicostephanus goldi]
MKEVGLQIMDTLFSFQGVLLQNTNFQAVSAHVSKFLRDLLPFYFQSPKDRIRFWTPRWLNNSFHIKICSVPGAPFCLVYTAHGIIAVSDRRVFSYTENGLVQQQFDFSSQHEKEGAWEEGNTLDISNLYVCSALAWKADGSAVYCVSFSLFKRGE